MVTNVKLFSDIVNIISLLEKSEHYSNTFQENKRSKEKEETFFFFSNPSFHEIVFLYIWCTETCATYIKLLEQLLFNLETVE
jgi:hypothetical protein